MAKNKARRRDTSRIANRPQELVRASWNEVVDIEPLRLDFSPLVRSRPSTEVEDHRTWHPDHLVPRLVSGRKSKVHLAKPKRPATQRVGRHFSPRVKIARALEHVPRFKDPRYVQICVRRKQRREVLLAKGRGGGGHRSPRRNRFSNVRC